MSTKPPGFSYERWATILMGLCVEDGLRSAPEIVSAISTRVVSHPTPPPEEQTKFAWVALAAGGGVDIAAGMCRVYDAPPVCLGEHFE